MTRPLRVLAVEDQAANVALLRAVFRRAVDPALSEAGLTVAGTLREARAELASKTFDAAILDMRLPDGNGLDLAREMSGMAERPRIIVLTANALPADELAARDAGADDFLAKPYDPRVLLELLGRIAASLPGDDRPSD